MPKLKDCFSFLSALLIKIRLYLKKAVIQIFVFLKKYIYEKRRRVLSLFLGILLFVLVHFARLGKQVIKQSDTITKEAIERIDDIAFENVKVGIETIDTYSKANTLFGSREKVYYSKHKEILTRLNECNNLNQPNGVSTLIDSCNTSVLEYYKNINDREALQEFRRPFIKYYLHDITVLNSIQSELMKAHSDAEFDKIWNQDIKKMKIKEENFYDTFYTLFKEKKYVRDSLIAYRNYLIKRNENYRDSL